MPRHLRPRSALRAYTAVEVMMAMTVMAIGAGAVLSMQKGSVQGNVDARLADVANSIGRTWVERLQKDSMQWTMPNSANPSLNNFSQAKLLSGPTFGQWSAPSFEMNQTNPETMSYAFDVLGRDLPKADIAANTVFCVNYELDWLVTQALPLEPGLIRATVRVLWLRKISTEPSGDWCDSVSTLANPEPSPSTNGPVYHSLYMTTTIREGGQ